MVSVPCALYVGKIIAVQHYVMAKMTYFTMIYHGFAHRIMQPTVFRTN